jgi:type II secretory pathway component PulF
MADVVESVTKAPTKALSFAKNNVFAFVLLAALLVVLLVAYQARNPGEVEKKIAKIPGVGKWVFKQAA